MKKAHILIAVVAALVVLIPVGPILMSSDRSEAGQQTKLSESLAPMQTWDQLPVVQATSSLPGRDPLLWRARLSSTANIRYQDVFPGVDLVYAGTEQKLDAVLIVQPDADPDAIRLAFPHADAVSLDAQGNVWALTSDGAVGLLRLRLAQQKPETRTEKPEATSQKPETRNQKLKAAFSGLMVTASACELESMIGRSHC